MRLVTWVAMFAWLALVPAQSWGNNIAETAAGGAESEVRRLERQWLDAYQERDTAAMRRIVADDFLITFPDGSMQDKPQVVASLEASRAQGQGSPRFWTEDVRSRTYGRTVILTGTVVTAYARDGRTVEDRMRYTDTYVERGGRWQVVASHLSNYKAPVPAVGRPDSTARSGTP